MATPFESREKRDNELIAELEKHGKAVSEVVGEVSFTRTADGYTIVCKKRSDGTVMASKQHKTPEPFRN